MKKLLVLLSFVALLTSSSAFSAQYAIDAEHTSVSFNVRHVLTKVLGRFEKVTGTFTYDAKDTKSWKAEASIDTASINTGVEKRDKHLRSADFFDVDNAKHPEYKTIKFVSTGVTDIKGNMAKLHGKFTMHGVTKDVVLDLEIQGLGADPWGNKIASFSAKGKLNRKDFGLTWNKALETGGVLVGDEVEISLDVAGLEQEPAAAPAKK